MTAKTHPENVLQDITELHDGDKEEKKLPAISLIPLNFEVQERRRISDEINAYHQAPLNF